jgi:hypothetical protein
MHFWLEFSAKSNKIVSLATFAPLGIFAHQKTMYVCMYMYTQESKAGFDFTAQISFIGEIFS